MGEDIQHISNNYQLWAYIAGSIILPIITLIVKAIIEKPKKKKAKEEKEELEKTIESLKDKEQDKILIAVQSGMRDIKSDVKGLRDEVSEIHSKMKDSEFIKKLEVETSSFLSSWVGLKEFTNMEIQSALFEGQKNLIYFAKKILYCEFKIEPNELKQSSYLLLKSIKTNVKIRKIDCKKDKIDYIKDLQSFLINRVDEFIFDFTKYKTKLNGKRRDAFYNSLKNMYEDIVKQTIELYEE